MGEERVYSERLLNYWRCCFYDSFSLFEVNYEKEKSKKKNRIITVPAKQTFLR
jgi:hypothetical protein